MSIERARLHDPEHTKLSHADTLVGLARAALARAGDGATIPFEDLDIDDAVARRFGDYELLEVLGAGGMGVVYRARQVSLDREVAIKFIAAGAADDFSVERFLGEARAAARLNHPNIVPVYEVGSRGGLHYFSMQLVRGTHLGARLARGPLTEREAIDLLLPLCDALDYAHRLGVLHLDLKPANILIDEHGAPLIADFGLARRMDASGSVQAQEVSGTPAYMAPEQVLIKQYRLTTATDLYSLGAVLFELLAGVSPHGRGAADDVVRRAVSGRLESLVTHRPHIDRDLAAVCLHCLDLDPKRRYADVASFAADLRRVREGVPVSVRIPGRIERVRRWVAREPRFAAAALVATVALALGIGVSTWQWQRAERERAAAVAAQAAESQQRRRAELANGLGVRLYAGASDYSNKINGATRTVNWLREKLPDDPQAQAEVLDAFATALAKEGSVMQVQDLLLAVVEVLGGEYRTKLVDAFAKSTDARTLLYAAILAWHSEHAMDAPPRFPGLLDRALAADPRSAFAWYVATTHCYGSAGDSTCARPEAAERLVELDADNGFTWAQLAAVAKGPRADEALHEAANAPQFRDYFGPAYFEYQDAIAGSSVAVPPLLAGPARALSPNEPVARTIAQLEAWSLPLPSWQGLVVRCDPARTQLSDAARADCLQVGLRMGRSKGGLITSMVGAVIVRRLARGTELETEMKALRLRYVFVMDQLEQLTPAQRVGYPNATLRKDMIEAGELEAFARMVKHYGLTDLAPAGWVPKNPETLLLPEERGKH